MADDIRVGLAYYIKQEFEGQAHAAFWSTLIRWQTRGTGSKEISFSLTVTGLVRHGECVWGLGRRTNVIWGSRLSRSELKMTCKRLWIRSELELDWDLSIGSTTEEFRILPGVTTGFSFACFKVRCLAHAISWPCFLPSSGIRISYTI